MNLSELRTKSAKELDEELISLRKEQFKLKMQLGTGQLSKHDRLRSVRRDIARVKTIATELANASVAT